MASKNKQNTIYWRKINIWVLRNEMRAMIILPLPSPSSSFLNTNAQYKIPICFCDYVFVLRFFCFFNRNFYDLHILQLWNWNHDLTLSFVHHSRTTIKLWITLIAAARCCFFSFCLFFVKLKSRIHARAPSFTRYVSDSDDYLKMYRRVYLCFFNTSYPVSLKSIYHYIVYTGIVNMTNEM